ncbi:MAG: hypothetical protein WC477_03125 [Patescibacteria group bacterium]
MQDIQEVYNRIQEKKKERKRLKLVFKDAFAESPKRKEVVDELNLLREKKKRIEAEIRGEYGQEQMDLENVEREIKEEQMLMDDIALSLAMKGESVTFKDDHDEEYQPIFAVKYKKIK